MPKSAQIKKYALDTLKQANFKQIQLWAKKSDGSSFHLDYIRKVCKGERYNFIIHKTAIQYIEKLQEFDDSMNNS